MEPTGRPLPTITPDDAGFWDATRTSQLTVPSCRACSRAWWPPRPVCPYCLSDDVWFRPVPPRGVVTSYVVFHEQLCAGFLPPYVVAEVCLEGDVHYRALLEAEPSQVRIGDPVEVVFRNRDGADVLIPCFVPAGAGGEQ